MYIVRGPAAACPLSKQCLLRCAVWDSSIVAVKMFEKRGAAALAGRRCLDLSAGCGLVGRCAAWAQPLSDDGHAARD